MLTILMIICIVAIIGSVFGLAFHITGAVIGAVLWILKLPIALLMWALGVVACCTIILIPVGLILFRTGFAFLM